MSTASVMKNQGQDVAPKPQSEEGESIREFISRAVHDLREPLRAIRLGSQLLGANGGSRSEENTVRGTQYVLDGADRIEVLIRDIAEYCYQEVQELDVRETDMEMVLREAKSELADELKSCGAVVTHDSLPTVKGNFSSLTTALRCLIGNACKFRSEAAPRIHIGAVQQGPEWVFSVQDNGLGFEPAYRDRIFRAFERLNGKQYPGSGLGLALTKRIVQQHNGRIWAESQPGDGSIFRFNLPVAG